MTRAVRNRDRYATTDFDKWATNGRHLSSAERWLIENYLSKDGDTMEAGTGGGSIVYAMRGMGFTSLTGFDNVPGLVQAARAGDPAGEITFDVQEATDLDYEDGSFDQIIYFQLLLSLVEGEEGRVEALREAYRVLRSGGVALFCVASRETGESRTTIRAMGLWLSALRALRRTDRNPQDWPHIRVGDQRNLGAFLDRGPYLHWFTEAEARELLEAAGFSIVLAADDQELTSRAGGLERPGAGLWFVCTKG